MTAILSVAVLVALCVLVLWWRLHKAFETIDEMMNENARLEQQNAVMSVQVNNAKVRKQNEENSHHFDRASVVERLREQGDLRD